MTLFAIPAAIVMMFGPKMGLPTFGYLDPSLAPRSPSAGAILASGLFFNRGVR